MLNHLSMDARLFCIKTLKALLKCVGFVKLTRAFIPIFSIQVQFL